MRTFLTFLILAFYLVGVYPSGTLASGNAVKVKVTHSHDHSHGDDDHHSHEPKEENSNHKHDGSSHTHEVLVSGSALGHITGEPLVLTVPYVLVSSLPTVDLHSQLGQRLSSIFRPPIL